MAEKDVELDELIGDEEIRENVFEEPEVDNEEDVSELNPETDLDIGMETEEFDTDAIEDLPEVDTIDEESDLFDDVFSDEEIGGDITIDAVNEMISENMFIKGKGKYRYIFDQVLSDYWFKNVLSEEEQKSPDMNKFYRWLNTENFKSKFDDDWKEYMIDEGNGDKIIELYERYDDSDLETSNEEEAVEEQKEELSDEIEGIVDTNVIDDSETDEYFIEEEPIEGDELDQEIDQLFPSDEELSTGPDIDEEGLLPNA